ncbi:MAG: hypothetical protein CR972_04110 [Candidatus Moraniibacteriota bacterium]|nr:MAG: hypothetical protein CR972_04110 [Candidatus Moranbacteria bacterium]
MEFIRILQIFRQSDAWAMPHLRRAHAILTSIAALLSALVILGYFLNILGYKGINILIGVIGILGLAVNSIHPGITLRVFQIGAATGIPNPKKNFWEGGEDFLKLYARGIHLILFYYSGIFFALGLIGFEQYPKLFWVALLGIILLALWPKETN